MLKQHGRVVLSASDLVNYLGCLHATFLDVNNIGKPPPETAPDPNAELLQKKGIEHEQKCLVKFRTEDKQVEIIDPKGTIEQRVAETTAAMRRGAQVIYQGALSLAASAVASGFSPEMIAALTAAGGVLILGIGLRLLELIEIRVANLLPALVLAPAIVAVMQALR